ncbi:MAG: hypothetical protein IRZ03_18755 [Acidobacterium ailaaui]|nr:hypothetical protein [Pseudacidobacterium ailaaui]
MASPQTRNLKTANGGKVAPQHYNDAMGDFEYSKGSDGALHTKVINKPSVTLVDKNGNPIDSGNKLPVDVAFPTEQAVKDTDVLAKLAEIEAKIQATNDRLNQTLNTQLTGSNAEIPVYERSNRSRLFLASKLVFPNLPTADGSGHTVHPSVVAFPQPWNGYKYWMAISGYKNGASMYENTHIFVSNDLITWTAPPGFTNPIDTPVIGAYQSDPKLVYREDTNTLYVYYRDGETLLRRTTTDGVNWTPRELCTLDSDTTVISPAILYISGKWHMWARRSSTLGLGKYTSNDGITWTLDPGICRINAKNIKIWHLDVWKDGNGFHMIAGCYVDGYDMQDTQMYYASSLDGYNWLIDELPFAPKGIDEKLVWRVYKGCAVPYVNEKLLVFLSGGEGNGNGQWTGWAWAELAAFPKPEWPFMDEMFIGETTNLNAGDKKIYGWFKPVPYKRIFGVIKLEHGGTVIVRNSHTASSAYNISKTINIPAATETTIDETFDLPWAYLEVTNTGASTGYIRFYAHLLRS